MKTINIFRSMILCVLLAGTAAHADPTYRFDIRSATLESALKQFANQSGLQVAYFTKIAEGHSAPSVSGTLTAEQALQALLVASGLTYERIDDRTVAIRSSKDAAGAASRSTLEQAPLRLVRADQDEPQREVNESKSATGVAKVQTDTTGVPEIVVEGSKLLNMDIRRSRDDAQPYVIFDRATIKSSGAANLDEFLKQRLTMNTVAALMDQTNNAQGSLSQINLRGLGSNQTLILIDGHRIASASNSTPLQPSLNGIPLAAVERVEVLPTTASGIYGGGATGGVVNIILRRDYTGVESKVTYENSFSDNSGMRRVDMTAGFSLEGGKTNILIGGNYSDADTLLNSSRNFSNKGQAAILANNPAFYLTGANPPLGYTTNIRSVNGSPLFGPGTSYYTSVPVGYAGGGGLAPLAQNAGRYNFDLANTAQIFGGSTGRHLLKGPELKSGSATVRRRFSSTVEAFIEGWAADTQSSFPINFASANHTIAATAPNNPFGQAIRVTVPFVGLNSNALSTNEERRMVGGVIMRLPRSWRAEVDHTWAKTALFVLQQEQIPTLTTAVGNGSIDVLRDLNLFPPDYSSTPIVPKSPNGPHRATLQDTTLRLAGPVASLPAGRPTLTMMLEYRDEAFKEVISNNIIFPGTSQSVKSAYLEFLVPIFSAKNALPGVRELELQLAGRHDRYTINGATGAFSLSLPVAVTRVTRETTSTDPTVGIRYKPLEDVMLRASYGTGFLPPSVSQLFITPSNGSLSTEGVDPLRGGTAAGPYTTISGGNPNLKPELSESWSMGMVFTPHWVSGARLSVDYSRIDKTDNIVLLTSQQTIDNEAALQGRIVRGARLPGDPVGWAGPITSMDRSRTNLSKAEVEVIDFAVDYSLQTAGRGTFDFYALATRQLHAKTQIAPTLPLIDNVGITSAFPLKFKANAGVVWSFDQWKLGWTVNYYDSYIVAVDPFGTGAPIVANQGGLSVPDQTYHNLFGSYRFNAPRETRWSSLLNNTEIQLNIKNVLNDAPPFDAGTTSTYLYSPFGDPRLASYAISLTKNF